MEVNEKFAEFYGILMGDGCISRYLNGGYMKYEFRIDGHATTDLKYYSYVRGLIKNVFEKDVFVRNRNDCHGIFLKFQSKKAATFFNKTLSFPFGKKKDLKFPTVLLNNSLFLKKALRGLFDTDGSLYFTKNNSSIRKYPIIEISTHDSLLLYELVEILLFLGFNPKLSYFKDSVKLHGKKELSKWMGEIGTSHPHKRNLYLFWKKKGYGLTYREIMKNGPAEI